MLDRPAECKAYQVSDQITCPACRLTWDVNDPDPPMCRPKAEQQDAVEHMGWSRKSLRRRFG